MSAYQWATEQSDAMPALAPVHRTAPGGVGGALAGGVGWILSEVGLLAWLERVTGDGDALHATAQRWFDQSAALRDVADRLKQGAATMPSEWRGGASEAFSAYLGRFVAGLEAMAGNLAGTALILNEAGIQAGVAEDVVTGIVIDAAEWVAAELAATAVADLLTLGMASIAGGLAESATLALFVERAAKVSADLGKALAELVGKLDGLRDARDVVRSAEGFRKLKELKNARAELEDLDLAGSAYAVVKYGANAGIGATSGLPMNDRGATGLAKDIGKSTALDLEGATGRLPTG